MRTLARPELACTQPLPKSFHATVTLAHDFPPAPHYPATAQGEFTAASRGRDYAAGSLVRSMEWDADLRAGVLGGNALAWMGKTLEDFMR